MDLKMISQSGRVVLAFGFCLGSSAIVLSAEPLVAPRRPKHKTTKLNDLEEKYKNEDKQQ